MCFVVVVVVVVKVAIYIDFLAFRPLRVGVEGRFGFAEPIFFLSDGFRIFFFVQNC